MYIDIGPDTGPCRSPRELDVQTISPKFDFNCRDASSALSIDCDYELCRTTTMETGTVKWFNDQKGYGFIQPDNGGKDVFVHVSAVERAGMRGLVEGQKISYELQDDRRTGKASAVNLQAA